MTRTKRIDMKFVPPLRKQGFYDKNWHIVNEMFSFKLRDHAIWIKKRETKEEMIVPLELALMAVVHMSRMETRDYRKNLNQSRQL